VVSKLLQPLPQRFRRLTLNYSNHTLHLTPCLVSSLHIIYAKVQDSGRYAHLYQEPITINAEINDRNEDEQDYHVKKHSKSYPGFGEVCLILTIEIVSN
jgi:hypothetical protein